MRLDVRPTLCGTPSLGDIVELELEGGRKLKLTYGPHALYDEYEWSVDESGNIPEELEKPFADLAVRLRLSVGEDWVKSYADSEFSISEGAPLFMVLVPQGMMHDWPRVGTIERIENINVL